MKKGFTITILLFLTTILFAAPLAIPNLGGSPVVDQGKAFNSSEKKALEDFLLAFSNQTDAQIVVLTMPTLGGENAQEFATRVGQTWGIGKKADTGVVFMFTTNDPPGKRDWFIATGYGVEGTLTDAKTGLIGRNTFIPTFKDKGAGSAALATVKAIAGVISNDQVLIGDSLKEDSGIQLPWWGWLIVIILVAGFVILSAAVTAGGGGSYRGHYSSGGRSSGGFSGFSGGGGHFGGGGAGGHF
jgi:uncharacterized protein